MKHPTVNSWMLTIYHLSVSSRIFRSKKTNFVEIFVENACSMLSLIENLAAASNYLTLILSYQNQKHNLQTS